MKALHEARFHLEGVCRIINQLAGFSQLRKRHLSNNES